MSKKEDGGPAFPLQSIGPDFAPGYSGMTLRDYFAAKAMQGFLSSPHATQDWLSKHLAESSWAAADSMLKVRQA